MELLNAIQSKGASFNTQPRGGGCLNVIVVPPLFYMFQHTAARRRLPRIPINPNHRTSFNTQPRGGGCAFYFYYFIWYPVSTHSRAEAAALKLLKASTTLRCFNTQPRGGGCQYAAIGKLEFVKFQHTAARRRLRS